MSESVGTTGIDAFEPWQLASEGAAIDPVERTNELVDFGPPANLQCRLRGILY